MLFDPRRRGQARARAMRMIARGGDTFAILPQLADDLLDRLADHRVTFRRALLIGELLPDLRSTLERQGIAVDVVEPSPDVATQRAALSQQEAALDVEPGAYDLVIWPGGLESVDDVPSALLRARLALAPEGLLLGACVGDGSFPAMREGLARVEQGRRVARMHPQLGLAAMSDLMLRVGFGSPVVDVDMFELAPASLRTRAAQLRAAALGNVMAEMHPLSRSAAQALSSELEQRVDRLRIIHFAGIGPTPGGGRGVRPPPVSPY